MTQNLNRPFAAISADTPYYDLGSFHRSVTTASRDAQIWFNRGLIWCYAFNHEQAAECFNQAIAHDPTCAMAYWGLAFALGPNYNMSWEAFPPQALDMVVSRTHSALIQALENSGSASPVEQGLIRALQARFPQKHAPKDPQQLQSWSKSYAEAMRVAYERFPGDLDVTALYADSLINLTPWRLWDLHTGHPTAGSCTLEAKDVLHRALAEEGGCAHPGLLHVYIHLMEMSSQPETVLQIADHLRGLVPDSGHLHHMPTHIDILCGDYQRAILSNSDAVRADEKYLALSRPQGIYTMYRAHNHHFLIYAAMLAGQYKVALDTAIKLERSLSDEILRTPHPPMAMFLESFVPMRVHVLIRFGRWQVLLKTKLPDDQELYCVTTAVIHYGKAVALAALGRVGDAGKEQELFRAAFKRVPRSRTLHNNTCVDILAIAQAMLDGELEYRRGNTTEAFQHLSHATSLYDKLPYDEPWGWMQPIRHVHGALLLEQGLVEEAADVYAADLGVDDTLPRAKQHPNNVWSLHGYHECLVRLGRGPEARILGLQLRMALARADVPIKSSCFCRLGVGQK
ncbi:tetratricopeptide repeat protein [Aspergillus homomorphus CBS 101889]|uniref:TPR domain protein n=1 Tax=Aspergillus homomorphus (strain CBS 101889) TaxID=1450537 RepID=A0A395HYS1_ASPHC|nr:TPR domain protein [Aspergillus homomorphus CBS 101889]RAL12533.1 TPR domain protein [Aspergillus homomorphus CBS 101889]